MWAAKFLILTQLAVSIQFKLLEEGLGIASLNWSAPTIALTPIAELLLCFAYRLVVLDDDIYGRMTLIDYEGENMLIVSSYIINPAIRLT